MLHASRIGYNSYLIAADGSPVARWDCGTAFNRRLLHLGPWPYHVTGNTWGRRFDMATVDGVVVAAACDVGRSHWTVGADSRVFDFHRRSWLLEEVELWISGQPAGVIRRTGYFSGHAVADLAPMSLPAQVFAMSVALCAWDDKAAGDAAAVAAAAITPMACAAVV